MKTVDGLPAISCRQLRKFQEMSRPHLILDVRSLDEFEAGHIDGSLHIPAAELEADLSKLASSKDEPIVVVGEEGEQAQETYGHLTEAGYKDVRFLLGGFDEWCKPAPVDVSDVLEEDLEQPEPLPHEHEEEVDSENDNEPLM